MSDTRGRDVWEASGAVCFNRRDYAGPVRRAIIVCIDFVAAIVLSVGVLTGVWYVWLLRYPQGALPPQALWVVPAVAYIYLTVSSGRGFDPRAISSRAFALWIFGAGGLHCCK